MAAEAAERDGVVTGADQASHDHGTQTDSNESPPDLQVLQGNQDERERLWWAGFEAARDQVVQILLEAGASPPSQAPEGERRAERASSSTDRRNAA